MFRDQYFAALGWARSHFHISDRDPKSPTTLIIPPLSRTLDTTIKYYNCWCLFSISLKEQNKIMNYA